MHMDAGHLQQSVSVLRVLSSDGGGGGAWREGGGDFPQKFPPKSFF